MMTRNRKPRFVTSSIADFKSRAALIILDDSISDEERKILVNQVRLEAMAQFAYYSAEVKALDHFIKSELKKHEEASQSVTALSQRK